jgi:hypothetical protein
LSLDADVIQITGAQRAGWAKRSDTHQFRL